MNTNLIHLLSSLEASELKTVVRFAKSPFHNSNKLIIELLKELLVYHPHFQHKRLTQEIIFRKIHAEGTAYDKGKMNLLMTQLVKLIERFIMYQEFEKDDFLQKKMRGQGFWKRNFEKKYQKETKSALALTDTQGYQDEEYFLNKYSINQDLFFKTITPTNHNDQKLFSAIDNLNQFYVAARLKMNIEQISRKSAFSNQNDDLISNELLSKIKSKYQDNVLINIFHNIIALRTSETYQEKLYDETQILFEKNIRKFKFDTKKLVYANLLNYNIRSKQRGYLTNYSKNIELYKIGMDNNLITSNNTITPISYINISGQAITEKDYEWSLKIILEYEKYLPSEVAHDFQLSALAFWYLKIGNEYPKNYAFFEKVLKLMRFCKIKRKDSRMTFRNKSIIIRAYYELVSIDKHYGNLLETELLNSESQLKKDKVISDNMKNYFLQFFHFTRHFLQIKLKQKKSFHEIQEIQNSFLQLFPRVAANDWLKEKFEELLETPQSKK